jgi:acetyltransferase-like isoleucine patch superfamily enzyme
MYPARSIKNLLKRILINGIAASNWMLDSWRPVLLRLGGIKVGKDCMIGPNVHFMDTDVEIGDNVGVNLYTLFDQGAKITLCDGVGMGSHIRFITGSHRIGSAEKRVGEWYAKPITVGKGTWLGANVTILGGADIAPGCIVAAHAVVKVPLEKPNAVYAGDPAVWVADIDESRVKPAK